MKIVLAISLLLASYAATATETVPCKREFLGAALAERAQNSTLESLSTSDFALIDFSLLPENSGYADYDYIVTVESTSRIDHTKVAIDYIGKINDSRKCSVKVKMLAD